MSHFRVTVEAVGLTKAAAIAQALRLLALMAEEAHERGHSTGSTNGNATGKIEEVNP
jgi:hypothetical protein